MSRKPSLTAFVYDRRNRLLSIGRNSYVKTHPLMAKAANQVGEPTRIYLHAEVAALVKIRDWSKAYRIVITRFNKDGNPVLAAPCACCRHVISQTGIKRIEHT
jgi:hypothetical protein